MTAVKFLGNYSFSRQVVTLIVWDGPKAHMFIIIINAADDAPYVS